MYKILCKMAYKFWLSPSVGWIIGWIWWDNCCCPHFWPCGTSLSYMLCGTVLGSERCACHEVWWSTRPVPYSPSHLPFLAASLNGFWNPVLGHSVPQEQDFREHCCLLWNRLVRKSCAVPVETLIWIQIWRLTIILLFTIPCPHVLVQHYNHCWHNRGQTSVLIFSPIFTTRLRRHLNCFHK